MTLMFPLNWYESGTISEKGEPDGGSAASLKDDPANCVAELGTLRRLYDRL
jgi:hypothetical protein